ncbi:MAG: DUF962 domain-containing protein [Bacteroidetes bacterium]|nr:DUF962 domain-containing protein [Bacteroidota bacterium]
MAQQIDILLDKYGESHQNAVNKLIHWVCVPSIMFSLFGLLYSIPFLTERSLFTNWATYALVLALVYYMRLSVPMFIGFVLIGGAMVYGVNAIYEATYGDAKMLALISVVIFAVAWVFQFVGHKIEGKKPSFLEDLQFLLIGPAWLLHFIYEKIGIKY